MPRSYSAFLTRADVPPRKALQQAVDGLKLKLALDDAYVPFDTSAHVPCTLDGEDAGFDLRFQEVDASFGQKPATRMWPSPSAGAATRAKRQAS